jgi:hypothetical protein
MASSVVSESCGGAVPQQQLCDYQAASPDEVALVKWTDMVMHTHTETYIHTHTHTDKQTHIHTCFTPGSVYMNIHSQAHSYTHTQNFHTHMHSRTYHIRMHTHA